MTDREKAVVMAYTGTCMLEGDKLSIFYKYIQDKLGHRVMTHELAYPEVQDAIKEAARDDFIEVCKSSDEPRVLELDEFENVLGRDVPLYFEQRDGISGWDIYSGLERGTMDIITSAKWAEDQTWQREFYGKEWRCWTSRPTDAQSKATPWE